MKIKLNGRSYDVVTLDFETYYDSEYSLKKIPTSDYIRDSRFLAHGVALKKGSARPQWFTGKNIALALREIDWSRTAMLCHHAHFDGLICSHHYNVVPALYLCSLSMARGIYPVHLRLDLDTLAKLNGLQGKVKANALVNTLGKRILTAKESAQLGGYALDDVDETHKVFKAMYGHFPDPELEIVDATVRMFAQPVLELDEPLVQAELAREVEAKQKVLETAGVTKTELLSNPKFAKLLEALDVEPPLKISPKTHEATFAFAKTDLDFQKLAAHPNPNVVALYNARLAIKSTITETRCNRLLSMSAGGMSLPVYLNYAGAHTLRWSGGDKSNFQNLKRGSNLRRALKAPKGHVIVVADSSQIEARFTAWMADQLDLLRAFAEGRDPYSEFASLIYGRHVDRKRIATDEQGRMLDEAGNVVTDKDLAHRPDALEGFIGKVCVLALGYGMGFLRFMLTLAQGLMGPPVVVSEDEAKRIVYLYRNTNQHIVGLWDTMKGIIMQMEAKRTGEFKCISYGPGFIRLPNGMFLHYPALKPELEEGRFGDIRVSGYSYQGREGRSRLYGGLLTENVIQAIARCAVADQLRIISRKYRVVMTTHDEIACVVPSRKADSALEYMLDTMSTPPDWAPDVPLAAEGGYAQEYSK